MADNKIIIGAVAAVVVIIAIAAGVVLMNNGNNGGGGGIPDSALGLVYGNANGDSKIDDTDLQIIQDIIDGVRSFADYPFADANHDGKVDRADYAYVQDFKEGTKKMTVYVRDSDKQGRIKTVSWPIQGIFATGGTNSRVAYEVIDLEDKMTVNATNDYISPVLDYKLYNLRTSGKLAVVSPNATTADFTELSKQKFSLAIIEYSGMNVGYLDDKGMKWFEDFGVDVLTFSVDNFQELQRAVATLGILTHEEDKAQKFIDLLNGIENTITTKLGDKFGTATVMNITMTNSISGTTSDYYDLTQRAGGKNLADFPDATKIFDPKEDPWLYEDKYNPKYLIHFKSMKYGDMPTKTEIEGNVQYFKVTKAYKADHYYYLNGTVPLPARMAYIASVLYPDVFAADWYLDVFQKFFDDYVDNPNHINVRDDQYKVAWTTEELKALIG